MSATITPTLPDAFDALADLTAAQRLAVLTQILRPAGGGVHVVSTGVVEQRTFQRAWYRCVDPSAEPRRAWESALEKLGDAKLVLLGVPADTGAGFIRGANQAPLALRRHLLDRPEHPARAPGVTDVGDVRVVPHLLTDAMLGEDQRRKTRAALFDGSTDLAEAIAERLPVSPLDLCRLALTLIAQINPEAPAVVIGGDHSVALPAFQVAHDRHLARGEGHLGLLHFDAHTDLLPHRLGVDVCFATWAYHANERLRRDGGGDGRTVQVGIRTSGRSRAHWESTCGLRQLWADAVRDRPPEAVATEIGDHLRARGVDALYVSNDIDGTDPADAAATGTPEPNGLRRDWVRALTRSLTAQFRFAGGDLVEVAPPLAGDVPGEPGRTLDTAAAYLEDLIEAGRTTNR